MATKIAVATEQQWSYLTLDENIGLDLSSDSETAPQEALLKAVNLFSRGNYLETDYGTKTFLDTVWGVPRWIQSIRLTTGQIFSFLITNLTVYRKVSNVWRPLGVSTATTIATSAITGPDSTIEVASSAGFTSGNTIAIELDDGTWHTTTVNGAPAGNVITLTNAIPVGETAAIGNDVVEAVTLAGTNDNNVDAVAVPFSDEVIFTNGVDNVKRINTTTFVVDDVPDLPTNTKCLSLAVWDNSVFLLNTTENAVKFPRRYRYSAAGDTTDWSTANDAGYADLHDSSDELLCGHGLGPYLAIYRTNSISRLSPTGDPTRRFDNPTVVHGTGAIGPHGVAPAGDNEHYVTSKYNIHKYKGGFEVQDIGDPIAKEMFKYSGRLEKNNAAKLFMLYDKQDAKVCIFYSQSSINSGFATHSWNYNINSGKWTERTWSGAAWTGFGHVLNLSVNYVWSSLIGSWGEQLWQWLSVVNTNTTRPEGIVLCRDTDQCYEYGPETNGDLAGSDILATLETKDFSLPQGKGLVDNIVALAAGEGAGNVFYSIDRGQSWTAMLPNPHLFTPNPIHEKFWRQVTFDRIRFRIRATGYFEI